MKAENIYEFSFYDLKDHEDTWYRFKVVKYFEKRILGIQLEELALIEFMDKIYYKELVDEPKVISYFNSNYKDGFIDKLYVQSRVLGENLHSDLSNEELHVYVYLPKANHRWDGKGLYLEAWGLLRSPK